MADPTMRNGLDELATQREQLATLHGALRAQGAELASYRRRHRRGRATRRALPLLLAALLVAVVPLATLAANPFHDLTGGVHDPNIDALDNAGITRGCDPDVAYCPTGLVTREAMASFLARIAGLGTNPPVVNALTAQTAASAQNATTATSAGNANTVGGLAPGELVRVARAGDGTNGTFNNVVPIGCYQTFVTLAITAPRAGFILVNGQAFVQHTGANAVLHARLRNTGNGDLSPRVQSTQPATGETMAFAWVFPVAAGPQSIVLEAQAFAPDWSLGGGTLTGVYVPFGPTGGATLGADAP